jgi:L-ascorbate metabolism protein UlaG (beta-lactamase superfamily)
MKKLIGIVALLLCGALAQAAPTKLTWYGNATWEITTPKGAVLMMDPWLKNPTNPAAKDGRNPIQDFSRVDYILISHAHFDHIADAGELGRKTGAKLIATLELGAQLAEHMGYPKAQMSPVTLMRAGGEIQVADGEVTVAMVPAIHDSGLTYKKPDGTDEIVYGGTAVGFVVMVKDGPTIYHTGDTAYYSDMKLIAENYHPDVGLINIGGHFGMQTHMAVRCAQDSGSKLIIPQHFGINPVRIADPGPFLAEIKGLGIASLLMTPGQTIEFEGHTLKH